MSTARSRTRAPLPCPAAPITATSPGATGTWSAVARADGSFPTLAIPNILYASGVYGSVLRWDRRTSLSQDITPWPMPNFSSDINQRKYRDTWTPVLVGSPAEKNALYFGTQYVMKTTDGGLHWKEISPDLTGAVSGTPSGKAAGPTTNDNAMQRGYGVVFSIAPSPLKPNEIWAGSDTGLLHLTRDGGASWEDVTPPGLSSVEQDRDDRSFALQSGGRLRRRRSASPRRSEALPLSHARLWQDLAADHQRHRRRVRSSMPFARIRK